VRSRWLSYRGTVGHCVDAPAVACASDQDCAAAGALASGCLTYAVRLGTKSTLRLNGFSIVGGVSGSPTGRIAYGVVCRGRNCTVEGGGGSGRSGAATSRPPW
jgi:hypothetical protein